MIKYLGRWEAIVSCTLLVGVGVLCHLATESAYAKGFALCYTLVFASLLAANCWVRWGHPRVERRRSQYNLRCLLEAQYSHNGPIDPVVIAEVRREMEESLTPAKDPFDEYNPPLQTDVPARKASLFDGVEDEEPPF